MRRRAKRLLGQGSVRLRPFDGKGMGVVRLRIAVLTGSLLALLCATSAPAAPRQGNPSSGGGLGKVVGGESAREGPGGTKRQPPEEDGVTERALDIAGLAARQGQTRS